MFLVLFATLALAAEAPAETARGEGLYRAGLYVALPSMVLDAVDRPSWAADDRVKVVGAIGRLGSYAGLGTMAFGAGRWRTALRPGHVKGRGLAYGVGLLGASFALDLATLGQYAQTDTPRALSSVAAVTRIGALIALTAQGTALRGAEAPATSVSFGVDASQGRVGLVASGRF